MIKSDWAIPTRHVGTLREVVRVAANVDDK